MSLSEKSDLFRSPACKRRNESNETLENIEEEKREGGLMDDLSVPVGQNFQVAALHVIVILRGEGSKIPFPRGFEFHRPVVLRL